MNKLVVIGGAVLVSACSALAPSSEDYAQDNEELRRGCPTSTPTTPTPTPTSTPTTPPSTTPPSTTPPSTTPPTMSQWPDATNTGVPAGTTLKASGGIHITTAGQVVSGYSFTGAVFIDADNVVLEKSKIVTGDFINVKVKDYLKGVIVRDCEIDNKGTGGQGIHGPGTFLRNNIYHTSDGIDVGNGDGTVIQDNYVHDMTGPSDAHFDTIQADGNYRDLTIRHNTLVNENGQTSVLMIDDYWGPIHGVVIDNNRLLGGGYTIYAGSWNGNAVDGIKITNNRLKKGYYGYLDQSNTTLVWAGNVDDATGKAVSQ